MELVPAKGSETKSEVRHTFIFILAELYKHGKEESKIGENKSDRVLSSGDLIAYLSLNCSSS